MADAAAQVLEQGEGPAAETQDAEPGAEEPLHRGEGAVRGGGRDQPPGQQQGADAQAEAGDPVRARQQPWTAASDSSTREGKAGGGPVCRPCCAPPSARRVRLSRSAPHATGAVAAPGCRGSLRWRRGRVNAGAVCGNRCLRGRVWFDPGQCGLRARGCPLASRRAARPVGPVRACRGPIKMEVTMSDTGLEALDRTPRTTNATSPGTCSARCCAPSGRRSRSG